MIWKMKKLSVSDVAILGMLIAVNFILSRFTFSSKFLQIDFVFIVTALIGQWYGPIWDGIIAGLCDIINTLLSGGGYFPEFTVSAILGAIIYGYFFYARQNISWKRIIVAQLLVTIIVNAFLNTLWLLIINHQMPVSLLVIRLIKEVAEFPIQIFCIYVICNAQSIQRVKNSIDQK
ncbi:folate ECF transporter [Philodulcilactobacillus myokoensis]|uniref:Folate ECF transporter n=1 Tax=Philodulcilactobacillus myokoensis TaxID=2929573 RepID=A0A9W6B1L2_9LACO|nr:folate family ECF transporter S component [Philodulcilactobacillus myokoensis]GLB46861.1 folate ECF transporter [Philodulcilactobacillus myokoensis]